MNPPYTRTRLLFSAVWSPLRAALLGALITGLAACQSVQTTRGGVVGVERTQRMSALVSEAELRKGAVSAYAQVVEQAREKGQLNVPAAQQSRVQRIANQLIAVTPAFRPDAKAWDWAVTVIRSDQVNAWCMPGGKIAVYTGLMDKLQLTDDELAAIIGHEIAHALREHARERASEQVTSGLLIQGAVLLAGGGRTSLDMAQLAYQVSVGLPNSRLHESEADRIGVELAARAGFDPYAAVAVWQKMAAQDKGGSPEFLSTHPSADSRIKDLQLFARRVEPLYRSRSGAAR